MNNTDVVKDIETFQINDSVNRKKAKYFIHTWNGYITKILPNNIYLVEWSHYLNNGSAFSKINGKNITKKKGKWECINETSPYEGKFKYIINQ